MYAGIKNLVVQIFVPVKAQTYSENYSVPHEESRKMFFVHFASFLQNQMSYGHVLCTTMIPYLP